MRNNMNSINKKDNNSYSNKCERIKKLEVKYLSWLNKMIKCILMLIVNKKIMVLRRTIS